MANEGQGGGSAKRAGGLGGLRSLFGKRWSVQSWHAVAALAVFALLIAGAVGVGRAPLERDVERLQGELVAVNESALSSQQEMEGAVADLEAELADAEAEIEVAREEAEEAYDRALEEVRGELSERSRRLDERERRLKSQQREVEQRERAVGVVERRIERNSFGNGRYQVGSDISAGTYRAPGGGGCYWAKLGTSDGTDIIANHFGPGPQTVVIDSPWFETNGCGTWVPS